MKGQANSYRNSEATCGSSGQGEKAVDANTVITVELRLTMESKPEGNALMSPATNVTEAP
jgi:hypothetical protein